MNKKNLEILGLSEGASEADIKSAYETLRAKYLEERFMDGEAGNNAAKMLNKIEAAYSELMSEMSETVSSNAGGEDLFGQVENYLREGNVQEAQRVLDSFNERGGQWHYLQSVVFYRKNWMNESKKQLEIAIQLEPENQKYKEAYKKLNDKINYDAQGGDNRQSGANPNGYQSAYQGQQMNGAKSDNQMGGNFCASCLDCCYTYMCVSCLCDGCTSCCR